MFKATAKSPVSFGGLQNGGLAGGRRLLLQAVLVLQVSQPHALGRPGRDQSSSTEMEAGPCDASWFGALVIFDV
jgi:hypothetical protein